MAGYVYRGSDFDAKPRMGPKPATPNTELCGTSKGIWRHRYNKETLCPKCREQSNTDRRNSWKENKDQPRKYMRLATIEKLKKAEALFAAGASQNEVHKKTGMSSTTIRQYFPGEGWTKAQAAEYTLKNRKERRANDLAGKPRKEGPPPLREV